MLLHNRFPNFIAFYWNDLWERKLTFIIWRHCFKWTVSSCRILGSQNWPKTKRKKERILFYVTRNADWQTELAHVLRKDIEQHIDIQLNLKIWKKSINCYRYPHGLFFHLNLFNCMNLSFCFFLLLKTFLLTSYFLSECANGHKFALSRNKFFSFFCWNFCQVKKMKERF